MDVNLGALKRDLISHLQTKDNIRLWLNQEVPDIEHADDGRGEVVIKDMNTSEMRENNAQFVLIGARGRSLLLLEKSGSREAKGYGGFPVGGQWLRRTNPEIIEKHHPKVYGKASVGAPPMSVPHLDTRYIDGEQALSFGPYAGFST